MKIGLIDNELCTRPNHSFPNLAIMKMSSYYKRQGHNVRLITFDEINPNTLFNGSFDKVFISKVFLDTITPDFIDNLDFVKKGGSGFYYDLAEPLDYEIEHSFPDYHIYDNIPSCKHDYYHKYSIGFLTRGCIRQCEFCINKNTKKVKTHSKLSEFVDKTRPYIMLLDDNITAYKYFYETFKELNELNIPFVFKQGMDFRLLNLKKMKVIFNSNYIAIGKKNNIKTFHYAFDNIDDYTIFEKNLKIYYENTPYKHNVWFYVLTGFDRNNKYDLVFFEKDIYDLLKRIELLFKYRANPYIMLHKNYLRNPNHRIINKIKYLCNFPAFITNKTMREAFKKAKLFSELEFLENKYSWFLDLKFNSKLYKI